MKRKIEKRIERIMREKKQLVEKWTEKYRPKTLNDVILDEEIKEFLREKLKDGSLPHLLLVGEPGTGKTTLAKVIVNELNADVLELNASKDRGIDVIRNQVANFVKTYSKKPKIVFFDEADGLTPDAQQSLRNLMETYSKNVRFILTANYPQKIIEPIKDRTFVIKFKRIPKNYFYELANRIIENERIYINEENKDEIIEKLISYSYPSLRSLVDLLQSFAVSIDGKLEEIELIGDKKDTKEYQQLKELKEQGYKYILNIPKNFLKSKEVKNISSNVNLLVSQLIRMIYDDKNFNIPQIRKFLIDNQILDYGKIYKSIFEKLLAVLDFTDNNNENVDDDIKELSKFLFEELNLTKDRIEEDILLLNEYHYRNNQVIDKEINFTGFILSLRKRTFPYVLAQFIREQFNYQPTSTINNVNNSTVDYPNDTNNSVNNTSEFQDLNSNKEKIIEVKNSSSIPTKRKKKLPKILSSVKKENKTAKTKIINPFLTPKKKEKKTIIDIDTNQQNSDNVIDKEEKDINVSPTNGINNNKKKNVLSIKEKLKRLKKKKEQMINNEPNNNALDLLDEKKVSQNNNNDDELRKIEEELMKDFNMDDLDMMI
jgi:replication factor C small subunit